MSKKQVEASESIEHIDEHKPMYTEVELDEMSDTGRSNALKKLGEHGDLRDYMHLPHRYRQIAIDHCVLADTRHRFRIADTSHAKKYFAENARAVKVRKTVDGKTTVETVDALKLKDGKPNGYVLTTGAPFERIGMSAVYQYDKYVAGIKGAAEAGSHGVLEYLGIVKPEIEEFVG
jgi:hypothetical protein